MWKQLMRRMSSLFFIDDELLLIEQGMSFSFQVTAWTQETGTRFSQGGKGALHQSQVRIKDRLFLIFYSNCACPEMNFLTFAEQEIKFLLFQVRKERMAIGSTSTPLASTGPG